MRSRTFLAFVSATASFAGVGLAVASPAIAQTNKDQIDMATQLHNAMSLINEQAAQIAAQDARIKALEDRLNAAPKLANGAAAPNGAPGAAVAVAQASSSSVSGDPATIQQAPVGPVGQAPEDFDRPPEVAVLGDRGSVVTRAGQLTGEIQLDYARADRNRALFRGIEVVESVLVGVFDINESRQDVLTAAASLRYGLFDKLEVGAKLPFVYRSDKSVLAPIMGSTGNDSSATIDSSSRGQGIGDLELSARYQLTGARHGWPFLIGNMQVVVPTGTNPFKVPRDAMGRALNAATGSGFWGVTPSMTAILPSDPAVLFATIGYTKNFGHGVDTVIPPVMITRVTPGDALSASAGIGVALNQRTSFNLGYAHSWTFGTRTTTRLLTPNATWSDEMTSRARDLQIGRLLFGVTYRTSDRTSINWSVEVGATDDATDLRTVLRIPVVLLTGR